MFRAGLILYLAGCTLTGLALCQVREEQALDSKSSVASKSVSGSRANDGGSLPPMGTTSMNGTPVEKPPAESQPVETLPVESPPLDKAGLTVVVRKDVTITDPVDAVDTVALETEFLKRIEAADGVSENIDIAVKETNGPSPVDSSIGKIEDTSAKETNALNIAGEITATQGNVNTELIDPNVLNPTEAETGVLNSIKAVVGGTNDKAIVADVVGVIQAEINDLQNVHTDTSTNNAVSQNTIQATEDPGSNQNKDFESLPNDTKTTNNDQTNLPPNDDSSVQNTITLKRAFVIPTNNVNSPRTVDTVSSIESSLVEHNPSLGSDSSMGVSNVIQTTSATPPPKTGSKIPDTPSTQSGEAVNSQTSTSAMTTSFTPTTLPTPVVSGSAVPSMKPSVVNDPSTPTVNDRTHGTVGPTSANVGQTVTDDGTIVFKTRSDGSGNQQKSFTTTVNPSISDRATDDNNTAPPRNTTLNVLKPTTIQTTVMSRTEGSVLVTTLSSRMDTNTKTMTETQTPRTPVPPIAMIDPGNKMASNAGPVLENQTTNTPAATTKATTTYPSATSQQSTLRNVPPAGHKPFDESSNNTTVLVLTTEGAPIANTEVTCPNITCSRSCQYGRQQDATGCETCKCKFSPECPEPIRTTKLLCMMQRRLGQTCKTDTECPKLRICCPGSCGKTCHRRTTQRSRVLTMMRQN